jgi:outer membrane protein OmpA-like peptidoglycan-associated protein
VARIGDQAHRQGWLVGGGLSYGHRWNFSEHWGMEAEIGVGYARLDFDKYDTSVSDGCTRCGTLIGQETKDYFGVTKAAVALVYTFGRTKQPAPEPVAEYIVLPPPVRDTVIVQPVERDTVYVATTSSLIETRQETGRATIQFPVNQSTLHPEMGQNRSELMKIAQSMEVVRRDPSSTIQRIDIKAFSSPEGDSGHNEVLACQRAETLRDYMVETFQLPDTLFNIIDGGENWEGLRQAIAISPDLTGVEREELIQILLTLDVAERKARLRAYRGGEIYTRLLREVYPLLRVSEYTIIYTVEKNSKTNLIK